jgi:hypothetical protein
LSSSDAERKLEGVEEEEDGEDLAQRILEAVENEELVELYVQDLSEREKRLLCVHVLRKRASSSSYDNNNKRKKQKKKSGTVLPLARALLSLEGTRTLSILTLVDLIQRRHLKGKEAHSILLELQLALLHYRRKVFTNNHSTPITTTSTSTSTSTPTSSSSFVGRQQEALSVLESLSLIVDKILSYLVDREREGGTLVVEEVEVEDEEESFSGAVSVLLELLPTVVIVSDGLQDRFPSTQDPNNGLSRLSFSLAERLLTMNWPFSLPAFTTLLLELPLTPSQQTTLQHLLLTQTAIITSTRSSSAVSFKSQRKGTDTPVLIRHALTFAHRCANLSLHPQQQQQGESTTFSSFTTTTSSSSSTSSSPSFTAGHKSTRNLPSESTTPSALSEQYLTLASGWVSLFRLLLANKVWNLSLPPFSTLNCCQTKSYICPKLISPSFPHSQLLSNKKLEEEEKSTVWYLIELAVHRNLPLVSLILNHIKDQLLLHLSSSSSYSFASASASASSPNTNGNGGLERGVELIRFSEMDFVVLVLLTRAEAFKAQVFQKVAAIFAILLSPILPPSAIRSSSHHSRISSTTSSSFSWESMDSRGLKRVIVGGISQPGIEMRAQVVLEFAVYLYHFSPSSTLLHQFIKNPALNSVAVESTTKGIRGQSVGMEEKPTASTPAAASSSKRANGTRGKKMGTRKDSKKKLAEEKEGETEEEKEKEETSREEERKQKESEGRKGLEALALLEDKTEDKKGMEMKLQDLGNFLLVQLYAQHKEARKEILGMAFETISQDPSLPTRFSYCSLVQTIATNHLTSLIDLLPSIQEWYVRLSLSVLCECGVGYRS